MSPRPLDGIRVVDLTAIIAGPFATYLLALLGAEVVKLEPVEGGDWLRSRGHDEALNAAGLGTEFLVENGGKRSLAIDLKHPEGQEIARRLIAGADVFVQNMTPGKAKVLGLDAEALMADYPRLIHCSMSAYGQDGPFGPRPAYDHIIQGASGLMTLIGTEETGPLRTGPPVIDFATGLNAALAVMSALRLRDITGRGQRVDVAMLDSALTLMLSAVSNYLNAGHEPRPTANIPASGSPASGSFQTERGLLNLVANTERQLEALCGAIGRPDLMIDPRFAGPKERLVHAEALRAILGEVLATRPAEEWELILNAAHVPAARVRTLPEALREPHVRGRALQKEMQLTSVDRRVALPVTPFKLDGASLEPRTPPPAQGEHTGAVLRELGLDRSEIRRLAEAGVIAGEWS